MSYSLILLAMILWGLMTISSSFLRVLMLLEALLLIASFYLLSFADATELAGSCDMFSALVTLALAGTEAALGLGIIMHSLTT